MRDSEGFVWISTQDGLTKYNGTHFIQYHYNRKDDSSLAHNYVWRTFEDSYQNIWIGLFGGGLCRFNKKEDRFYRYDQFKDIADHGIRTFAQFNDSILIVGTDHGMYLFNLFEDKFIDQPEFIQKQFDVGMFHTHSLEVLGEDVIVAGENGGYLLSPNEESVFKIQLSDFDIEKIKFIKTIGDDKLLLAGLHKIFEVKYDAAIKKFIEVTSYTSPLPITINDSSIDDFGEVLLIAEEGLFKLNFLKQTLIKIRDDQPSINNLTDKVAYCVEEIEPNLKWVGTKTQIYEFSEKKKAFQHIYKDSLCGSAVLGMTEDENGNLWVATRRGLGRIKNFDQSISKWEYFCYDKSTNPEIPNDYILNIKVFSNLILIGHRRKGFSILNLKSQDRLKFETPPIEVDTATNDGSVSNFLLDNNENIWISTSGNGVIKWSPKGNNAVKKYINVDGQQKVLSHNFTFDFIEKDENWIAVASAAGISLIHKNQDTTYQILRGEDSTSLSGNFIMDFHKDQKGQLWVCTDGGINAWNKDDTFKSYTKNEGLPNDNIYGMLEHNDQLWISSNKGLARINNAPSLSFKTFSKEDDVLNEEHNQFSFYKTKRNILMFGGKSGITFFDPDDIVPNSISAMPVIEKFHLFNENGNSKLDGHINYTDKITLDHNENFLSFDLSSISYFKSDQNQYRYLLSPLNQSWIDMGKRNFISLNGLAPGDYKLNIQSSNNDGIWGDATKTLEIEIKRPIYSRWYAWLLYLSIVGAIGYAFYKMRINHITNLSVAREEERTKIRERSAQDFHDEVGSLITKLSLLNQFVLSNIAKEEKENIGILNKMQSNIQRIRTGMKDFIWVLDPSKDSIGSTLIKIKELGNDIFEHSGIKFQSNISKTVEKNLQLNGVQRRQLILLVKETLHNVLKHSNAKNCDVSINQKSGIVQLSIVDNGQGFDLENYKAGYGLKSMKARARKMNGKIETKSEIEKGTQINISFPTHPNGL